MPEVIQNALYLTSPELIKMRHELRFDVKTALRLRPVNQGDSGALYSGI